MGPPCHRLVKFIRLCTPFAIRQRLNLFADSPGNCEVLATRDAIVYQIVLKTMDRLYVELELVQIILRAVMEEICDNKEGKR